MRRDRRRGQLMVWMKRHIVRWMSNRVSRIRPPPWPLRCSGRRRWRRPREAKKRWNVVSKVTWKSWAQELVRAPSAVGVAWRAGGNRPASNFTSRRRSVVGQTGRGDDAMITRHLLSSPACPSAAMSKAHLQEIQPPIAPRSCRADGRRSRRAAGRENRRRSLQIAGVFVGRAADRD